MWEFHCQRLLDIIRQRRQEGPESHSFLVWMICLVDTYALLSGAGQGTFVQSLARDDLAPTPTQCLPGLNPGQEVFFQDELPYFRTVLELNQEVVFIAVKVGEIARDIRAETSQRESGGQVSIEAKQTFVRGRRERAAMLQNLLRLSSRIWADRYPGFWPQGMAQIEAHRPMGFLHHV
jgi:hypothetical protein